MKERKGKGEKKKNVNRDMRGRERRKGREKKERK